MAWTDAPGVLLLLFSLIETRGWAAVAREFRTEYDLVSLIGDDACCEQARPLPPPSADITSHRLS